MHKTVYERFAETSVVLFDTAGPYRPKNMAEQTRERKAYEGPRARARHAFQEIFPTHARIDDDGNSAETE